MEKFNIAICDDDIKFANELCEKVKALAGTNDCDINVKVLHKACDLAQYCIDNKVDIILTDIDLPDENSLQRIDIINVEGFKAVQEIQRRHMDVKVVFVSGHEEFAYRSFDCKPFSFVSKRDLKRLDDVLAELIALLKIRRASERWAPLIIGNRTYSIDVNSVMYFKKAKNYIESYAYNKMIMPYRCGIAKAYEQLSSAYYINVHRSYLVNCRHIIFFDRYTVTLSNDMEIHVTRDEKKFEEARQIYMRYRRSLR